MFVLCVVSCVHIWRTEVSVRIILGYSSTLFTESRSLSNLELTEMASLTCYCISAVQDWIHRWTAMPIWHLRGLWASELRSSHLYGKWFNPEPSLRASRQFACSGLMPLSLCVGISMEGNPGMISRPQRIIELRFKPRYTCAQNLRPFLSTLVDSIGQNMNKM